ncbi:hypothetical protein SAMN05444422_105253 [Halobiforma haloterrestris]|uniref:Uncharacterized protein n=1 Tax=Natronobacterium haloterrestre TaxID=148448 RepID=A0A1I1H911_NATHA|nr:hypothetical protein SAMN05444422_105253 [Halobiforma haloterrestris]
MLRPLAIGFAVLEILAPERIVGPAERLAFENPDDGRLRPWTLPIARLEGLAFLWLLVRPNRDPNRNQDRGLSGLQSPLGAFGAVLALAPRTTLEFFLDVAYENAADLEVKPWVVPATRLLGALYLAVGLFAARADAPEDDREKGNYPASVESRARIVSTIDSWDGRASINVRMPSARVSASRTGRPVRKTSFSGSWFHRQPAEA